MAWNGDKVVPGSNYGDPRKQAERARLEDRARLFQTRSSGGELVHGMTPEQMAQVNARMGSMMPRLSTSDPTQQRRDLFATDLPKGANWSPSRTAQYGGGAGGFAGGVPGLNNSGGGGRNMYTTQRPYQPEFESPDRQQYPVHRILANRYWRLFIKLDPVIGTGLDMYSEMPWSDVKLTGEGVEGEVREVYETMWESCSVLSLLPTMVREFLGIGEVVPHCFFDDKEGMWTYIALHNPDNLEVIDAPFIKMEPIVEFVPDDQLRAILTSSDPELQQIRQNLPPELVAKLYARQNIRINTEVNATFIARKLHPYETRGTSILSRMWRILMYEDAIFNASIATARRHAGPLKIAKLGNPQTNWIPGPEQERRFAELVAQAEMDPHAWIVYHYGLQLEAFGTTDRVMTINREWEIIERIKLAALGLSRAFLTGELTYACFAQGTPVTTSVGIKNIEDVVPGEYVFDRFGKLALVEAQWDEEIPNQLVRLKPYGSEALEVTKNHKYPVLCLPRVCNCGCGEEVRPGANYVYHHADKLGNEQRKTKYQIGPFNLLQKIEIQTIPAEEIKEGDFLVIPRQFTLTSTNTTPGKARLLGYFLAEGAVGVNSRGEAYDANWTFGIHEQDTWSKDTVELIAQEGFTTRVVNTPSWRDDDNIARGGTSTVEMFPMDCITIDTVMPNGNTKKFSRARPKHPLAAWLYEHGGNKSWGKRLSQEVMGWPLALKQELLKGYFRGDGHKGGGNQVTASTVSRDLAYQLQLLCVQCGMYLKLRRVPKEELALKETGANGGYKRGKWDDYVLTSDGSMGCELAELVWGGKVSLAYDGSRFRQFRDDEFVYVKVSEVELIDNSDKKVYNLTTSGGSYIAGGFSTYNSATAGLQVFLRRLQSMRSYFEQVWLKPKFFKPIAEINQFYKHTKAEQSHGIRVTRTAQELREQGRLIVPKLDWANKLNPAVDKDLMDAYSRLEEGMGIRISKTKKMAVVNLSFEEELKKATEEDKFENKFREEHGAEDEKGDPKEIKQIIDKTDETKQDEKDPSSDEKNTPVESSAGPPAISGPPPNPRLPTPKPIPKKEEADRHPVKPTADEVPRDNVGPHSPMWKGTDSALGWDRDDVADLIELLQTGDTDSAHWSQLKPTRTMRTKQNPDGSISETPMLSGYDPYRALQNGDAEDAWDQIDTFLQEQGYPDKDIEFLRRIIVSEGVLPKGALDIFEETLPEDTSAMSDSEFGNLFAKSLETASPFGETNDVSGRFAKTLSKPDTFLVGLGAEREVRRRSGTVTSFTEALIETGSTAYDVKPIASKAQFDTIIHGQNCTCHRRAVKTPKFEAPDNFENREQWQSRLQHSKISPDAKRYIKQIENEVVDGWSASFEHLWKQVEHRLDNHQPIDSNVMSIMVSQNVQRHLEHLDQDALDNAFTGLYSEGKEVAYKPTQYKQKKLDRLKRKEGSNKTAFLREAVTIDTHEDKVMLEQIKQTALEKVKSITDVDLRNKILEKLTESGASNVNPVDLANQIIADEAAKKKEKLKETIDEEARAILKLQLKSLYESQAYQLQRIMRTEAVNGFVLSQLMGYKEQGIEKVQWNGHNDLVVCNTCKTLNGQQFDIEYLLSEGGRYPLTFMSHPQCRCWYTPVIAYVTLDDYIKQYEESHPEKFVQGETLIDSEKLQAEDVLKLSLETAVSDFEKVPVEHVDSLKQVASDVAESWYDKHAPAKVKFVKDIYDLDEFQSKAKPDENLTGKVVSWHDPDDDTTYISSYAPEFEPINEVYLKDWANRIWEEEESVRTDWTKLYNTAPERGTPEQLSKDTLEKLRTTFKPFPLGQTYYLDGGDAVGLSRKLRDATPTDLYKALNAVNIDLEDVEKILRWRKLAPVWDLKSGEAVTADEEPEHVWISHEASENPEAFFRESLTAYVSNPFSLEMRDPKLYSIIRKDFFAGKEFKKR
jgi:SPP1 gp7 family putative phage head morphogenesis protein